jgi:aminoglycoside phosphotransferase (APT) family kinase protein
VTIAADRIVRLLRGVWPDVDVGSAVPLSGGFWAALFRVPVRHQPAGVADEVVVRLAPHRAMGAKEAEVQRAVAAQGFPTPPVWLSCAEDSGGGWWSVMDFCPGAPLLTGLDGMAALRRAPALLRTLPTQLAQTMASLHRLDPEPVTAAVRAATSDVAWSVSELVDHLRSGAAAAGRRDIVAALNGLAADAVTSERAVVCHGDLHPFNILDQDGVLVVIDWTGAVVADPCFDLAFTEVLLANPPLVLPGPLAPVGAAAGRLLARRFISAYARANPGVVLDRLAWFRALHGARVLIEVTTLRTAHGPDAGGHPFATIAPAAARSLTAATGVSVSP